MSLKDLCEVFGTGLSKISDYNSNYNNLNVLNSPLRDEFIRYSIGDSKALLQLMFTAQGHYFEAYGVDLAKTLSLHFYL